MAQHEIKNQHECFELTEEEQKKCEERGKGLVYKILMTAAGHPLTFAKTLIQLGHDPYPLVRGKKWVVFGEQVHFQPNAFKYVKNVYYSHGLATIYTGIGTNLLVAITGDISSFCVDLYLDKYYPEIGGELDQTEKEAKESELDNHQLFRVKLRKAIRTSIAHTIGVIAARPFTVIMIRQIAQYIGNETKYRPFSPWQPLLRIGAEEGPSGYFSGLIPQVLGGLVFVWSLSAVTYAAELGIRYLEKNQDPDDEESKNIVANMRTMCDPVCMFLVNAWRYPMEVVSSVIAVTGSGLAISMLPYTPLFSHWADAYDYLKPHEIKRGARLFLRQEQGPIGVGTDGKLYASKKHFI